MPVILRTVGAAAARSGFSHGAALGLAAALLVMVHAPAAAQTQSVDVEYYMQPASGGANTSSASTDGLSLSVDLSGITLSFNTGGFFDREFVAQSPLDAASSIEVSIPGFAGSTPLSETIWPVSGGTVSMTSDAGEVLDVVVSDASTITLVPYPLAPQVLFFELAIVPASTSVTPDSGASTDFSEIKAWGIIVTSAGSFDGAWVFGQNQQLKAGVTF